MNNTVHRLLLDDQSYRALVQIQRAEQDAGRPITLSQIMREIIAGERPPVQVKQ